MSGSYNSKIPQIQQWLVYSHNLGHHISPFFARVSGSCVDHVEIRSNFLTLNVLNWNRIRATMKRTLHGDPRKSLRSVALSKQLQLAKCCTETSLKKLK